jgi:uncharacterized protein YkwD
MKYACCFGLLLCLVVAAAGCGGGGGANEDIQTAVDQMIQDHNAYRTAHSQPQFTELTALNALAQTQAEYMASIGTWAQNDAQGHNVLQRIQAAGFTADFASSNVDLGSSEASVWAYWAVDAAALTPIGNPQNDQIGAGMAIASGVEFWCVIYAHNVAPAS